MRSLPFLWYNPSVARKKAHLRMPVRWGPIRRLIIAGRGTKGMKREIAAPPVTSVDQSDDRATWAHAAS